MNNDGMSLDKDVHTGRFFGAAFVRPVRASPARWMSMKVDERGLAGDGRGAVTSESPCFFIAHQWDEAESASIVASYMNKKGAFYFLESGDIKWEGGERRNPLAPQSNTNCKPEEGCDVFDSEETLQQQKVGCPHWAWDKSILMNRRGTYFLYTEDKVTYLLYNFFHTTQFKRYYMTGCDDVQRRNWTDVFGEVPDFEPNLHSHTKHSWTRGGTITNPSLGMYSVHDMITTYCRIRVHKGTPSEGFADPSCCMLNNKQNAIYSAILQENRFYDDKSKRTTFDAMALKLMQRTRTGQKSPYDALLTPGSGDGAMGTSGPMRCVCDGWVAEFLQGITDRSFMHRVFNNRWACTPQSLTMISCPIVLQATTITLESSQLKNNCGNDTDFDAYKQGEEESGFDPDEGTDKQIESEAGTLPEPVEETVEEPRRRHRDPTADPTPEPNADPTAGPNADPTAGPNADPTPGPRRRSNDPPTPDMTPILAVVVVASAVGLGAMYMASSRKRNV